MKCSRILALLLTGVFVMTAVSPAHAADDSWQSLTLPHWSENLGGADPGIAAGDHVYELVSGIAVGLQCNGHLERYEDSGIVTGPCNWAVPVGYDRVTIRWRPVVAPNAPATAASSKTKYILTGDRKHKIHRLGLLADGKWRVRNFSAVEVRVWSSEDRRCTKPRTGDRIVVKIGNGRCDGEIELRIRNPNKQHYRIWVTRID